MITPTHTSTNAKSVPTDVKSPASDSGRNAPNAPTKKNSNILHLYGVRNLGCTSQKSFGSSPSSDIVKNTRLWPSNMTSITEENPNRIATVTPFASQSKPGMPCSMAYATEASFPTVANSRQLETPVNTHPNRIY